MLLAFVMSRALFFSLPSEGKERIEADMICAFLERVLLYKYPGVQSARLWYDRH